MRLPGPLVDTAWLEEAIGTPGLVLADVRWYPNRGARSDYEAGHLPGAVFVDVDTDLAALRSPGSGRHPLPTPEAFAQAMARVGIGDDDAVVAYDDAGGSNAARLWWMLSVTGHAAAVLDGGLQAWTGLETGSSGRPRGRFTPRAWPVERLVDAEEVDRLRTGPDGVVLDARTPERYRGETEPIDPVPGHIPGARNAPWAANLDPGTGRFLPADDLRRRYEALGAGTGREVVAYCGSGVTACHDLLALALAGIQGARLYPGSWSEWIADFTRPVAAGDDG